MRHSVIMETYRKILSDCKMKCQNNRFRSFEYFVATKVDKLPGDFALSGFYCNNSGDVSCAFCYAVAADTETEGHVAQCPFLRDQNSCGNLQVNVTMKSEYNRLRSFDYSWPEVSPVSPAELAAAGFYRSRPHVDSVDCVFCDVELSEWEDGDEAMEEHWSHSPDCLFVLDQVQAGNIPVSSIMKSEYNRQRSYDNNCPTNVSLSYLDLASKGFYYLGPDHQVACTFCETVLNLFEVKSKQYNVHYQQCLLERLKEDAKNTAKNTTQNTDNKDIHTLMAYEYNRLQTLTNVWPSSDHTSASHLAASGLYCPNPGKAFRCYLCGAKVDVWNAGITAIDQHKAKHGNMDSGKPAAMEPPHPLKVVYSHIISSLRDLDKALLDAADCEDLMACRRLVLDRIVDINYQNSKPLWQAIDSSNSEVVMFLVANGASLTPYESHFESPLLNAGLFVEREKINWMLLRDVLGQKVGKEPGEVNEWSDLHRLVLGQLFREVPGKDEQSTMATIDDLEDDINDTPDRLGFSAKDYMKAGILQHRDEWSCDLLDGLKPKQSICPQLEKQILNFPNEVSLMTHTWTDDIPPSTITLIEKLRDDPKWVIDSYGPAGPDVVDHILNTPGLGLIPDTIAAQDISREVHTLMTRVATKINQINPGLDMFVIMQGSTGEGTKQGLPDEYDYQMYVGGLPDICEIVREGYKEDEYRACHITLDIKLKEAYAATTWSSFCAADSLLKPRHLFHYLHILTYQVLCDPVVWKGLRLLWKPYGVNIIHLLWKGHTLPGLALKIDLMYCFWARDWWPLHARQQCPLVANYVPHLGCCVRIMSGTFRPSSCEQELALMRSLETTPRLVYMFCKTILSVIDDTEIKSYDLKNSLMHVLEADVKNRRAVLIEEPTCYRHSVVCPNVRALTQHSSHLESHELHHLVLWVGKIMKELYKLDTHRLYYWHFSERPTNLQMNTTPYDTLLYLLLGQFSKISEI